MATTRPLKIFQTIEMSDSIRGKLKWSKTSDKLAVVVKRGMYIMDLDPVPSNVEQRVNLKSRYFGNESTLLDKSRLGIDLVLDDTATDPRLSPLLLDPAIMPAHIENPTEITCLEWHDSSEAVFTLDKCGRLLLRSIQDGLILSDISKTWLKICKRDVWLENTEPGNAIDKLMARANSASFSSIKASDGILVTAQRNQTLNLWTVDGQEVKLMSSIDLAIRGTDVCDIFERKVSDDKTRLVFVGTTSGLVLVVKVSPDMSMACCGFAWSDVDHLAARSITLVSDGIVPARSMRVAFSKGPYVVVSELQFNQDISAVQITGQQCVQVADGQKIVDIVSHDSESAFVIVSENGPLRLLVIPKDLGQPCEDFIYKDDFDTSNRCSLSAAKSTHGVFWTLLQSGRINRRDSPGQLLLLSDKSLEDDLMPEVVRMASDSATFPSSRKDVLELFRVFILGSYVEQIAKTLSDSLGDLTKVGNPPLCIWLCIFFSNAVVEAHEMEFWSARLDNLYSTVLARHASRILENDPVGVSDIDKQSLSSFLKQHGRDVDSGIGEYEWSCRICGCVSGSPDGLEQVYDDMLECKANGHKWPRCCVTLRVIDGPDMHQCRWCGSVALESLTHPVCTLCLEPMRKTT